MATIMTKMSKLEYAPLKPFVSPKSDSKKLARIGPRIDPRPNAPVLMELIMILPFLIRIN